MAGFKPSTSSGTLTQEHVPLDAVVDDLVTKLETVIRAGDEISFHQLLQVKYSNEANRLKQLWKLAIQEGYIQCQNLENLKKLWFLAVMAGDIQCLDLLLMMGVPVNTISVSYLCIANVTALYCAAKQEDIDCFKFLLDHGAKLRMEDLVIAASQRDIQCLTFLIKNGNFTAHEYAFAMATEVASQRMEVEIFDLLVQQVVKHCETKRSAKLFLQGAIKTACSTGNTAYAVSLLNAGVLDLSGNGSLMYIAASRGHVETMKLLHKHGDVIDCEDGSEHVPLIGAACIPTRNEENCHNRARWRDGDKLGVKCLEFLLSVGANVNRVDEKGQTALIKAAFFDNVKCARLLLNNGSQVNHQTHSGNAAIHWAVRCCSLELVHMLMEQGADPNLLTSSGTAPLHLAISHPTCFSSNCLDLLKFLIRSGANVDLMHGFDQEEPKITPVIFAAQKDLVYIVQLLNAACCDLKLLQQKYYNSDLILPSNFNKDVLQSLLVPKCLYVLCRNAIRNNFLPNTLNNFHYLPLPKSLIDWLHFPEFDNLL